MPEIPYSVLLSDYVSAVKGLDTRLAGQIKQELLATTEGVITESSLEIIKLANKVAKTHRTQLPRWTSLRKKLQTGQPIHVLFLNDVGFNAGAGIGMARQAQAFLKFGHSVSLLCGRDDANIERLYLSRYEGKLVSSQSFRDVVGQQGWSRSRKAKEISRRAYAFEADLIITGNFHAFSLSEEIIRRLFILGMPIVTYAHDCDWVTGGCAHFLYHQCELHLSGCPTEACPKAPDSYPKIVDTTPHANWLRRTQTFADYRVPIATNSKWSLGAHEQRFGQGSNIALVPLGIDTTFFSPGDSKIARQIFGLPHDKKIILAGSGFFRARGKGGEVLNDMFRYFANRDDIHFAYFGRHDGAQLPGNVSPLGYISSEEEIMHAYRACDVFVNPVTIEAFGQTMLEAAACGRPVISYDACGVGDISVHGVNALHADPNAPETLLRCIDKLVSDEGLYTQFSENSRLLAVHNFDHGVQLSGWRRFLLDQCFEKENGHTRFRPQPQPLPLTHEKHISLSKSSATVPPPLFTVAVVVYNCGPELNRTVLSILNQNYPSYEFVLVDGASQYPATRALLDQYADSADAFISEPDDGIYDAMEKAALISSGKYIIYMGAGDFFAGDDVLENVAQCLVDTPDLIIGNVIEERLSGELATTSVQCPVEKVKSAQNNDFSSPWMRGLPPHQGTFVRTELVRELGFDRDLRVCADLDQILKIAARDGTKIQMLEDAIAQYPNGGFSATSTELWAKETMMVAGKYANDLSELHAYFDPIIQRQKRVDISRTNVRERLSAVTLASK